MPSNEHLSDSPASIAKMLADATNYLIEAAPSPLNYADYANMLIEAEKMIKTDKEQRSPLSYDELAEYLENYDENLEAEQLGEESNGIS